MSDLAPAFRMRQLWYFYGSLARKTFQGLCCRCCAPLRTSKADVEQQKILLCPSEIFFVLALFFRDRHDLAPPVVLCSAASPVSPWRSQGDDPVLSGCLVYFLPKARKRTDQNSWAHRFSCWVSHWLGVCLVPALGTKAHFSSVIDYCKEGRQWFSVKFFS